MPGLLYTYLEPWITNIEKVPAHDDKNAKKNGYIFHEKFMLPRSAPFYLHSRTWPAKRRIADDPAFRPTHFIQWCGEAN
ncbi:hypothetical protein Pdw03_2976 [Penicillium digitatum]|uniref:Uncharacterized protein n=1 Tax=Penicillium digitatum TaxID=36651 RepID=A0A7T6XFE4_PENDI|nr:hypothetical protein Pdw03_2976 [Penicillium digitatum]